jgi:hypothetical protein
MSKQQSATLPNCDGKSRKETKSDVLTIRIFKRTGSKYWQALVKGPGGLRKRVTTRTTLKPSAAEFAELAFRHFSRMKDRNAPPRPTPRQQPAGDNLC